ncbi:hypothetical protein CHS0354_023528, partial [Potamilus streckersoni]
KLQLLQHSSNSGNLGLDKKSFEDGELKDSSRFTGQAEERQLARKMFSVRIVTTDYYQADPIPSLDVVYSEFRGAEVKKVPLVRVFGATPA